MFSKFSSDNVSLYSHSRQDRSRMFHNLGFKQAFVPFEYPERITSSPDWPLIVEVGDSSKPALEGSGSFLNLGRANSCFLTESARVSSVMDVEASCSI